jgi:hypothetical protein
MILHKVSFIPAVAPRAKGSYSSNGFKTASEAWTFEPGNFT